MLSKTNVKNIDHLATKRRAEAATEASPKRE